MKRESKIDALPLIALAALPGCDCGGTSDGDAGTTTTTTATTTTTGGTGTTTTVTSPSSTTAMTIPGTGTACDPFRYTAADGPDVPEFGPWPEYTIGQVAYLGVWESSPYPALPVVKWRHRDE